jgi:hypothetical protein
MSQLPIINSNNLELKSKLETETTLHIELSNKFAKIIDKQSDEKNRLEKELAEIDHNIDQIVYDLYGLTNEERKLVEDAIKVFKK